MDFNEKLVDIDDGLSRLGGNMTLYKRLLGRFIAGNHYDALDVAVQSGDVEEVSRQAHTLKGVSANLSLIKVSSLSLELEQNIKNNLDYSASLTELKEAYDATVDEINEIMK